MKILLAICLFLSTLWVSESAVAAVEVSGGAGASCAPVIGTLRQRWFDVKNHMQPASGNIKRADEAQFICLSPYVLRNAQPKRILTGSDRLQCFTIPGNRGLGVCCDNPVTACAQLHPGLFPELAPRTKEKSYEKPKSDWVRPPTDNDQWGSN